MQLGLFLFLAAVPILEIVLLVKLGQWLGVWPTVAIVIFTALLGTYVLHRQGFKVLNRVMESMAAGKPPVGPAIDGAFLMSAGILLIAPGVITDLIGLLLLIPPLRHAVAAWSVRRFLRSAVVVRSATFTRAKAKSGANGEQRWPGAGTEARPERSAEGGPVIDGEFERLDERTLDPRKTAASSRPPVNGSERRGDAP